MGQSHPVIPPIPAQRTGGVPPHEQALAHQLALYSSGRELVEVAGPFIEAGAALGAKVLVISTPSNLAVLRAASGAGAGAGAMDFVEAHTWYRNPGRAMAALNEYVMHAAAEGLPVYVVGEPIWTWAQGGPAELAEWACYESALNVALADQPAAVLCLYDTERLPGTIAAEARRTHPEVVGSGASPDFVEAGRFAPVYDAAPDPAPASAATLPLHAVEPAAVQRFAARQAREFGLFGHRARWLSLAAYEAAREAAADGAGGGLVRLWAEGSAVTCELRIDDYAPPRIAGYVPPSPAGARGEGLWLARQLCDQLTLHPRWRGTTIRMMVKRVATHAVVDGFATADPLGKAVGS